MSYYGLRVRSDIFCKSGPRFPAHAFYRTHTLPEMVIYQGVLIRRKETQSPIMFILWCPTCLSFSCFLLYSYHFSLVVGLPLHLIGLKNARWKPRVQGWVSPCQIFETQFDHYCYNPYHLIVHACHPGPDTRTQQQQQQQT